MNTDTITYKKDCLICSLEFFAKRIHAATCSGRCRFILYKLNENYCEFENRMGFDLYGLSPDEVKFKQNYIKEKRLLDNKGNEMDFINGYKDIKGSLKISVFRVNVLKYIDVWNDVGHEITHKYFKYS